MNTLTSTDGKRIVTSQPADSEPTIIPSAKHKHVVLARTESGTVRTWQTTSRDAARKIRNAYKSRGLPAVYTVSI